MRKVCVFIGSRANYSSIRSAMKAIQDHPDLELQVVAGASALLDRYGQVVDVVKNDGFKVDDEVYMIIEAETPVTMAKSAGLGLLELPTTFDRLKPDIVLTIGDRFETIASVVAAAYMNIAVAHTMGGEISGTIDESIRHALTKLSHIHFPANTQAAERIIKMGEQPDTVFNVGCPRMDMIADIAEKHPTPPSQEWLEEEGVGGHLDLSQPYLIVSQHAVTTDYGKGEAQINQTLEALHALDMPTLMLWPNSDAGSEDVARGIRKFREHNKDHSIRFYKNFTHEVFIPLMMHCACMIGNSSGAIRDGAFLGVPAVNIGTRQEGRDRGHNVLDVGYDAAEIQAAVKKQLEHGKYDRDPLYGDGTAGKKIADTLATCEITIQKKLTYS